MFISEPGELYKIAFFNAAIGMSITSLDGEIFVNNKFAEMLGYTPEELRSNKFQNISHPDDFALSFQKIEDLKNSNIDSVQFEKRYIHKDGRIIWAEINTHLHKNEEGEPEYFITSATDITAKKYYHNELLKIRRLYEVKSSITSMLLHTKEIQQIYVETCRIIVELGKFKMAWIGKLESESGLIIPITHAGKEEGYLSTIPPLKSGNPGPTSQALRTGKFFYCNNIAEDEIIKPWKESALERGYNPMIALPINIEGEVTGNFNIYSEDPFYFNAEETQLLDEVTGQIAFVIGDITSRRKNRDEIIKTNQELLELKNNLEKIVEKKTNQLNEHVIELNLTAEELKQERLLLQETIRELEAFSYSVSHDLRAPLRTINGFVSILLEDHSDKLDIDVAKLFTVIQNNARLMGVLIDELLEFSRLSRKELSKKEINVKTLFESVYSAITSDRKECAITFKVNEMPQCFGDPVLIKQVAVNLISNAVKYSSKRIEPVIEMYSTENETSMTYFIKDNGAGFDMKYKDKLFGVFQRLHDNKDFEGTGVGLAIVHRIITRHGGTTGAEGELDKGSVFWFSLPK